ncbi:conserved hypothetical protein [Uncinocarpus reesii 1704]|uniref:Protein PXR1 n=1 Tax=Uncinocarpus reesii (strain UAMH 1704) TaxID=336963 RepID=C4K057_UNCRE|nr:uncharacterized protein UREG_07808 [Uncinocarpus reesii 1704]EEP82943.1 conserved hypothetical protein [Uncinocarpus reesii 1704]
MGLAGPKKRSKISHDPNNTTWSRSTTGYGHRIMSAQGWTPGSFLGAPNAAHSSSYTSASSSHIRVVLKDDTLGLGARPRNPLAEDEPTGLDAFKDLLGRLNGKSETELVQEQRRREDIKLLSYVERRWKTMAFIPGGYLVKEDSIDDLSDEHEAAGRDSSGLVKESLKTTRTCHKTEDRKETTADSAKINKSADKQANVTASELESYSKRNKKKSKKRKEIEAQAEESERKPHISIEASSPVDKPTAKLKRKRETAIEIKEHRPLGRHVIRNRYIQQKKMALMDTKSLNENPMHLVRSIESA